MPFPSTRPILAIAFSLLLVACGDSADEPDDSAIPTGTAGVIVETLESGTPVPGLALTPRPGVVADLATARRYETEGDIEAAAEAYIAIAAAGGADSIEATLAAGRLLIESSDYEDARTLLEAFVQEQAGTPEGLTATYLLGRAYNNLEMYPEALEQFDAYIAAGGPATPYAYLDRSDVLLSLERGFEAAQAAQMGLNADVPSAMDATYLLTSAQSYERAGAFLEAIGYYTLLLDAGGGGDVALALQRIASLKQVLGDPSYTVERDRLLQEYPASSQALVALQEAVAEGEEIAPDVHGLVLYRHNEYTQAEPYFQAQIDVAPDAAESALSYYYLGAIVESRGDLDAALENYEAVDLTDPQSPLADDALWWRARIHENEGELADAGLLYAHIVDEYPFSEWADDAAFRRGMLSYRDGSYLESAQIWASDLEDANDPLNRQRLQLWQGKALLQADQPDSGSALLMELRGGSEDQYFGIRSMSLRDGQHEHLQAEAEAGVDLTPEWDWTDAEQWLTSRPGQPVVSRAWESDPRWARAQELWRLGRGYYGDLEVYSLIESYASEPGALYTLSRELLSEGRYSISAGTGQRLLAVLDVDINDGVPKSLMSLAYPAAFGPLVERYAEAEGISPLLLLAFMRQESSFNPRAVSPVGALGLTQLLQESAQAAAAELGITAEVPREQLLHADLNLRLGARFMATQLERFDGDLFVALAAYNGGPTAAMRWDDIAGNDADLFLETIEYGETRYYVRVVSENYAMYRYIYGGEPEPNLPR